MVRVGRAPQEERRDGVTRENRQDAQEDSGKGLDMWRRERKQASGSNMGSHVDGVVLTGPGIQ